MHRNEIEKLFDPQQFEQLGVSLMAILSKYLDASIRGNTRVLNWQDPDRASANWVMPLPCHSVLDSESFLSKLENDILSSTLRVHHPRNLGHQVAPPLPMAALADLVSALTNQAMAVYEAGPSATLIERQVIQWLAGLIGWDDAAGILTSGGAQANLTALLAARQCTAGWDVWKSGVASGTRLRILASEHAHYSVSRAAGIMGLGTDAVLAVATDDAGRMCLADLERTWQESLTRGEQPFVVVATAGCTPTGSIDPLAGIGRFCQAHQLWFHVDGAHGASMLLSEQLKPTLNGIEMADSVVWDGHKLLFMPATVSAVIFRHPKNSYAAFAQEASYLFQGGSDEAETYNTGYRTLECTKRMMGLKLWTAFSLYGSDTLGELVKHVFDTACQLSERLEQASDFTLLMPPQTNIVCFRHVPQRDLTSAAINAYQIELRRQLVESGAFHLTQARIHGDVWLRATVMNPLTILDDLEALLVVLRQIAETL